MDEAFQQHKANILLTDVLILDESMVCVFFIEKSFLRLSPIDQWCNLLYTYSLASAYRVMCLYQYFLIVSTTNGSQYRSQYRIIIKYTCMLIQLIYMVYIIVLILNNNVNVDPCIQLHHVRFPPHDLCACEANSCFSLIYFCMYWYRNKNCVSVSDIKV